LFAFGGAAAAAQTEGQIAANQARTEMVRGNNWMATNLQKRAAALEPTLENRFNLAVGYQRTGRIGTARNYFRGVSADDSTPTPENYGGDMRTLGVGFEAADRVLFIDTTQKIAANGEGAPSAEAAATNVSATVGGPGEYEVTDEQARALDRQARSAR
jgi:hypothetical protein